MAEQDYKSWLAGLIEYSHSPNWFVAISDQYNYGNEKSDHRIRIHYFNCFVGYTKDSHRITLGYGRQREGLVGGVCRQVPSSNGLTVSISTSF